MLQNSKKIIKYSKNGGEKKKILQFLLLPILMAAFEAKNVHSTQNYWFLTSWNDEMVANLFNNGFFDIDINEFGFVVIDYKTVFYEKTMLSTLQVEHFLWIVHDGRPTFVKWHENLVGTLLGSDTQRSVAIYNT